MDTLDLQVRLDQACTRRDREPAFSPDWDAAMAHVEDLTRQVRHLEAAGRARMAILARVPTAQTMAPAAR